MEFKINYYNMRLAITVRSYIDSYFEKYLDTGNSRYTYDNLLKDIVTRLSRNGICYANTMMDYIKSHYGDKIDFDKLIIDLMNFKDPDDTPDELKLVHVSIFNVCPPAILRCENDQQIIDELGSRLRYFDRVSFIYQKLIDDAFYDQLLYIRNKPIHYEIIFGKGENKNEDNN